MGLLLNVQSSDPDECLVIQWRSEQLKGTNLTWPFQGGNSIGVCTNLQRRKHWPLAQEEEQEIATLVKLRTNDLSILGLKQKVKTGP